MIFSKSKFALSDAEREEIAQSVRNGRALKSVSQKRLAEKLGFTSSIINLVENSKVELSQSEMNLIIVELGIKVPTKTLKKLEVTQMDGIENVSGLKEYKEKHLVERYDPSVEVPAPEPALAPTPEPDLIKEEITVDEQLILNLAKNNQNGYTTTKVINALLNWFVKETAENQLSFMCKYETDITFYAAIASDLIKAGDFVRAKEIIDMLEARK